MICKLIKLFDSFDMSSHYSFLFLEHSDVAVDFHIGELFVLEVPQGCWHLILSLVVE